MTSDSSETYDAIPKSFATGTTKDEVLGEEMIDPSDQPAIAPRELVDESAKNTISSSPAASANFITLAEIKFMQEDDDEIPKMTSELSEKDCAINNWPPEAVAVNPKTIAKTQLKARDAIVFEVGRPREGEEKPRCQPQRKILKATRRCLESAESPSSKNDITITFDSTTKTRKIRVSRPEEYYLNNNEHECLNDAEDSRTSDERGITESAVPLDVASTSKQQPRIKVYNQ